MQKSEQGKKICFELLNIVAKRETSSSASKVYLCGECYGLTTDYKEHCRWHGGDCCEVVEEIIKNRGMGARKDLEKLALRLR